MDEKRKAELRVLCNEASPSPYWVATGGRIDANAIKYGENGNMAMGAYPADAEYIAAACNALPELLDDNDAKDRENERLNAQLAEANELYSCARIDENNLLDKLAASECRANAAIDDFGRCMDLFEQCDYCRYEEAEHCRGKDLGTYNHAHCWEWRGVHPKGETE